MIDKKPKGNRQHTPDVASNEEEGPVPGEYSLRLYVAGQTPKSMAAIANLKRICEQHLAGRSSK